MSFDPGQLNRKITIETRSGTLTAMGALADSWTSVAVVWARRLDRKARQSWEADGPDKILASGLTDWLCHKTSEVNGVSSGDRITYGGEVFEILALRTIEDESIEFTTRLFTNG